MTLSDFPSGGRAAGKPLMMCAVSGCTSPKVEQVTRGRESVRRWCMEHALIYDHLIQEAGAQPVLEGPWPQRSLV